MHTLDVINGYRKALGAPPLTLAPALCLFAVAGSVELSNDHLPHQHFINAELSKTLWTDGFTTDAGENQGDPNGWGKLASDPTLNETAQIDAILAMMFAEGPGDGGAHLHYENIVNPAFTRLGVGLLEVDGRLYFTNDFSQ